MNDDDEWVDLYDAADLILDFAAGLYSRLYWKILIRSGLNFHWKYKNQKMSELFLIRENTQNYWSLYVNNKKLFFCVYKIINHFM